MDSQQQLSSQDQQQLKKMRQSLIQKRRQTRKKLLEDEYPFQFVIDAVIGIHGYLSPAEYEKEMKKQNPNFNVKQQAYLKTYKEALRSIGGWQFGEIEDTFKRMTQMPKRTDHYHIIQNKVSDLRKEIETNSILTNWTFRFQFRAGCKTLTQVLEWDHLFYFKIASQNAYFHLLGKHPDPSNTLLSLKQKSKEMKQKCIYSITYYNQALRTQEDEFPAIYHPYLGLSWMGDSLLLSRYLDIVNQQQLKPLRVNQRGDLVR